MNCNAATNFCDSELSTSYRASGQSKVWSIFITLSDEKFWLGRNVYDISKVSMPTSEKATLESDFPQQCVGNGLCYLETDAIEDYLNLPETRSLLGVTSPLNFSSCSNIVGAGFRARSDRISHPTREYVAQLLGRGVRVLIYAGTYDWQCNWVANKLWVERLEWSGNKDFNAQEWHAWTVNGTEVGITKSAGPLTFATIWAAGHMISVITLMF